MRPEIQFPLVLLVVVAGCLAETKAHQSGKPATASDDAFKPASAQSQTSDDVGFQDSEVEQSSNRTVPTSHVQPNDLVSRTSPNEDIHQSQRNANRLTPMDQKENRRDLGITAEIRKRIIGTNGLSINARNIKVITADGKVTLLGRVNSDEEHSIILRIAEEIADSVDDRIQVNSGQNSDKRMSDEKKDG